MKEKKDLIANRYVVLSNLGEGNIGVVYKCHDPKLDHLVAVKLLKDTRGQNASRFQQEARTTAKLEHPNIVKILDYGEDEGELYLVLEFCQGVSLAERIAKEGALAVGESLEIFDQILEGLIYAEGHNILHRDLKPSNIILDSECKTAKIVDFGLAKNISEDQQLTKAGATIGSPAYMSPEAALGKDLDSISDIYSMGCLMFETLTGRLPFQAESAIDTLMKRTESDAPSLAAYDEYSFPKELIEIVDKCLKREKELRYESFDSLRKEIAEIKDILQKENEAQSQPARKEVEPTLEKTIGLIKPAKPKRFPLIEVVCLIAFIYVASFLVLTFNKKELPAAKSIHKDAETFTQVKLTDIDSVISLKTEQDQFGNEWKSLWGVTSSKDMKPALKEPGIKYLKLLEGDLTGSAKNDLNKLDLIGLNLKLSILDESTFEIVSKLKDLKVLYLDKAHGITSDAIEKLEACKNLEKLYLRETDIDDQVVSKIALIKSLKYVNFYLCKGIEGKTLSSFNNCPDLETISLDYCKNLKPEYLKPLSKAPKLRKLQLKKTGFKNDDLKFLTDIKLEYLDLRSNKIKSKELDPLFEITTLEKLYLPKQKSINPKELKRIKTNFPHCKIFFQ